MDIRDSVARNPGYPVDGMGSVTDSTKRQQIKTLAASRHEKRSSASVRLHLPGRQRSVPGVQRRPEYQPQQRMADPANEQPAEFVGEVYLYVCALNESNYIKC